MLQLLLVGSGQGVVTLSGESHTVSDISVGYDTTATFRFNTDGTIDKGSSVEGAAISYLQVDASTDWIVPNVHADALHEVRLTNLVGDAFFSEAAAEDTWIAISSVREWKHNRTISGITTTTFDFEIRFNGGPTLASTSYTLACENTT